MARVVRQVPTRLLLWKDVVSDPLISYRRCAGISVMSHTSTMVVGGSRSQVLWVFGGRGGRYCQPTVASPAAEPWSCTGEGRCESATKGRADRRGRRRVCDAGHMNKPQARPLAE